MRKFIASGLAICAILIGGVIFGPELLNRFGISGTIVTSSGEDEVQSTSLSTGNPTETDDNAIRLDVQNIIPDNTPIIVDAIVVPSQHADLSMSTSGRVTEVLVAEGDYVEPEQVILRLQNVESQAALRQAEARRLRAHANLEEMRKGSRPEVLLQAEAELDIANARLAQLKEGVSSEQILAAEANLSAAQAAYAQLTKGANNEAIIAAQAEFANAEAVLTTAQRAYDLVKWRTDIGSLPESQALMEATNNHAAAQARLQQLNAPPSSDLTSAALAKIREAEAELKRVQTPGTANQIAEAEAEVRRSEAGLALLKAGSSEGEIAAATAAVLEADAAVELAQAALADTELRSPIAGTLVSLDINPGELVSVGSPIASIGDMATIQIETKDLAEIYMDRVQEGNDVIITFDAFDDLAMTGTIVHIKSIGESNLGDVTYTATIRPDQQDTRLLWNMTASVTIQ